MAGERKRPNLVLITADQLRGDCLGVAGHPVVETPYLDTLAGRGAFFQRAYSATPSCIPARAALLTGTSQERHGRVGYEDGVPWEYEETLPGLLATEGYHTQGVGKMHFFPARALMGFHNVVLHDGYLHHERKAGRRWEAGDDYLYWLRERAGATADYAAHGVECNSWVARPWHMDESLHPTNWVVTESIRFLERRDPTKPFFLWMSFVRPHAPLDPPQAYWDMYADRDIPAPPVGEWAEGPKAGEGTERRPIPFNAAAGALDERALKRARAAYYALITHIDHQIGRFLDALGENGAAEDTLIVFTSDHGELLGDHNLFRKALPYEGSARVPMIVSAAQGNRFGLAAGAMRDEVVELRDVLPTFLDAAGAAVPDTVDGKSMLAPARGEKAGWRKHLHGEHVRGDESVHYVTDGRMKYIWFSGSGREQIFDLGADPTELRDLAGEASKRGELERMRGILVKELDGREEGFTDGSKLVAGRPVRAMLERRR